MASGFSGLQSACRRSSPQATEASPTADINPNPHLGAHDLNFKRNGKFKNAVATRPLNTQASGSTILACVGRGSILSHVAPSDNKENVFAQVGTTHAYVPRYPNSGTALYAVRAHSGGHGNVFTAEASRADVYDELTLAVVEVIHGGKIRDQWSIVQSGNALKSLPITTSGPATLVAFWWGDADGSEPHFAIPNNDFTVIDSVLNQGSLVQCAVAVKHVSEAGTFDLTWTATPTQGAQLWLVAVEKES